MFLFDFNKIWIVLTDLIRSFQFLVSRKLCHVGAELILAGGLDMTEMKAGSPDTNLAEPHPNSNTQ